MSAPAPLPPCDLPCLGLPCLGLGLCYGRGRARLGCPPGGPTRCNASINSELAPRPSAPPARSAACAPARRAPAAAASPCTSRVRSAGACVRACAAACLTTRAAPHRSLLRGMPSPARRPPPPGPGLVPPALPPRPAPPRRLHLPPRDPSVHVPGRRLHPRQRWVGGRAKGSRVAGPPGRLHRGRPAAALGRPRAPPVEPTPSAVRPSMPRLQAPAARASTARSLRTRTSSSSTPAPACCPWCAALLPLPLRACRACLLGLARLPRRRLLLVQRGAPAAGPCWLLGAWPRFPRGPRGDRQPLAPAAARLAPAGQRGPQHQRLPVLPVHRGHPLAVSGGRAAPGPRAGRLACSSSAA